MSTSHFVVMDISVLACLGQAVQLSGSRLPSRVDQRSQKFLGSLLDSQLLLIFFFFFGGGEGGEGRRGKEENVIHR